MGGLLISGPFRWVKLGSQMRLALMDSDIYRELESYSEKVKESPIPVKDLVVGGIYSHPTKEYVDNVFLGPVRYKGKRKLAFAFFCLNNLKERDYQRAFEELVQHGIGVRLHGSHSLTRQVGKVTVPKVLFPHQVYVQSGCREGLIQPTEVEWL